MQCLLGTDRETARISDIFVSSASEACQKAGGTIQGSACRAIDGGSFDAVAAGKSSCQQQHLRADF
jgi:hypothetical protein